jgi:hypothetical protein
VKALGDGGRGQRRAIPITLQAAELLASRPRCGQLPTPLRDLLGARAV